MNLEHDRFEYFVFQLIKRNPSLTVEEVSGFFGKICPKMSLERIVSSLDYLVKLGRIKQVAIGLDPWLDRYVAN